MALQESRDAYTYNAMMGKPSIITFAEVVGMPWGYRVSIDAEDGARRVPHRILALHFGQLRARLRPQCRALYVHVQHRARHACLRTDGRGARCGAHVRVC